MGIIKKLLIALAVLLFMSPVLVVFLSYSKAEELDRLLKKLPFYDKVSQDRIILQHKVIDIPDAWRSNYFLPGQDYSLQIPEGFEIGIFASRLGKIEMLTMSPSGDLYVSSFGEGKIIVLPDADQDGFADEVVTFASDISSPNGLQFYQDWLYVVIEDSVIKLHDDDGDMKADQRITVIDDIAIKGGNSTKDLAIDKDGNIYVSIPASCNACEEEDEKRATILKYDSNGENRRIYATGIRASLGLLIQPDTEQIWATDAARGDLGDQEPRDEFNAIDSEGDYGWPTCFEDNIIDLDYDPDAADDTCTNKKAPLVMFRPHTGPAGIEYIQSEEFPRYMQNKFLVALHGSDLSSVPMGCQIVIVDPTKPEAEQVEIMVDGWIVGTDTRGRPLDIVQADSNTIFISDDYSGTIFRLTYAP